MGLSLWAPASPDPSPARPNASAVRSRKPRMRLRHAPEYGIALLLVGFAAAVALTEPRFRASDNLLLILEQSSTLLLVSLPFALLLMCRHIDLSVGSAIAVAGVVTSKLMAGHGDGAGWHPALVVLASVATLVLALRGADPVVRAPAQDRIDAATPATQARNHASRIPR